MQGKRTTGLSPEQFVDVCERVEVYVGRWQPATGRRRTLRLAQAVKVTVMYLKNNITQEVIAELMDVHQSTISRVIAQLEVVIADALAGFVPDLSDELSGDAVLVDGSLCPCWSWTDARELYSGKHKTTGHNHQFVATLNGDLLHISDPLPGRTHDAKAIADSGLLDIIDPGNSIGDKGYIGTGLITPFRKPQTGELLDWQIEFNAKVNQIRYPIERTIANFKTWRTMHTDYRRPRHTYPAAFRAVRALHFFKIRSA